MGLADWQEGSRQSCRRQTFPFARDLEEFSIAATSSCGSIVPHPLPQMDIAEGYRVNVPGRKSF